MVSSSPDETPARLTTRSLTVVLVSHNDAAGLAATVERLHRALIVTTEEFEIVVFDDGSTDNSPAIAADLAQRFQSLRVIRNPTPQGAGHCFRAGCAEAKFNFLVYVPADNTWPYRSYIELFGNIGKADVITSFPGNLLASMRPLRRIVSRSYTLMLNMIFRLGLHYYNGLTIYPTGFLRSIEFASRGLSFQAEVLIKAIGSGYSFIEVVLPVDDLNVVKSRAVTPRNILDSLEMLVRLGVGNRIPPASAIGRRAAAPAVEMAPSADEIGLGGAPSRSQPSKKGIDAVPRDLRIAITGASSGIGAALALAFAGEDRKIFVCARHGDRLNAIARQKPSIRAIVCDVTQEADVAKFVSEIAAETDRLDVLINCAGAFGEIGAFATTDSSEWWNTLRVNVFGPYLMIKHCLPLLERGRKPRIINIAGGGAFSPFANYSAYACSKAASVRLTECLAVELQPKNIRVNAVSPGIVATGIHKATLEAGEERAGRLQYRRTMAVMAEGVSPSGDLVNCFCALLSPSFDRLTGKTISSNFDPWQTEAFRTHIEDITSSDLYTMRRVNLVNLPDGYLRKRLARAWANFGSGT